MNRTLVLGIASFLAFVGLSLVGQSPTAVAGHGCHACYGCAACYACDGCFGCAGCDCGGLVLRRPLFWRLHARHGCWGCHGCGGYGCHSCYGCHGCWGCHGAVGCGGWMPVVPGQTPSPSDTPAPAGTSAEAARSGAAAIDVELPADAEVVINGRLTTSTGHQRRYVSHGLADGEHYVYELRARLSRDGRQWEETRTVTLAAGQSVDLVFRFDPSSATVRAVAPPATTDAATAHVEVARQVP